MQKSQNLMLTVIGILLGVVYHVCPPNSTVLLDSYPPSLLTCLVRDEGSSIEPVAGEWLEIGAQQKVGRN